MGKTVSFRSYCEAGDPTLFLDSFVLPGRFWQRKARDVRGNLSDAGQACVLAISAPVSPDWIIKSAPPRALLKTHSLQGGIRVASLDVGHYAELDVRDALERHLILFHLVHGALCHHLGRV